MVNNDMNSTDDEYINITPLWMHEQLIICIISILFGSVLLCITFVVPVMIIIRKIRRDKHQLDLTDWRRVSDFM